MEILILPDNQIKSLKEPSFDRKSRENYFEMLKVALENLSVVYEGDAHKKVVVSSK